MATNRAWFNIDRDGLLEFIDTLLAQESERVRDEMQEQIDDLKYHIADLEQEIKDLS